MEPQTLHREVRTGISSLQILRTWLIAHVVLQFADFASTYLALSAGGMEANPVTRSVLSDFGWGGFLVMKCLVAAGFVALWPLMPWMTPKDARWTSIAMGIFALFMFAVVINNAVVASIA